MTAVPGGRAALTSCGNRMNASATKNLLFALAKQNEDAVTEKQNISRLSLKVIVHQPLLIM